MIRICTAQAFWTLLQILVDVLQPFQAAITETQADRPISNIWRIWTEVFISFEIYLFLVRESVSS
jgi:hypothetical protein